MYNDRIPYPFYTDDGTYRKFLGVIKDMSLWVSKDAIFPIRVYSVSATDSGVLITLQDSSDTHKYILSSDSGYIHDNYGVIAGLVQWDTTEVVSVAATIKGGDPIPWGSVYVLPIACKVKHKTPMFRINMDGSDIQSSTVRISGDGNEVIISDNSINLYQYDEDLNNQYIDGIEITSGDVSTGRISVDGYIWLRSDAECDLRVVTERSLRLRTIIEGD